MSWDSYIDNLIAQSKDASGNAHADMACIIGLDGGAKWTSDQHPCALKLSQREASVIARCFKEKNFRPFMQDMESLVDVEGAAWIFLREIDSKIVYARASGQGLTLQATKTAVVIAHTPGGAQQGNTNKAVGVIAEYLESLDM